MAVPPGPALAEFIQNRRAVNAEAVADSYGGPAHAVETDCLLHLLRRQATATHRHIIATQDLADRSPLDLEPISQFVHRRPRPRDQQSTPEPDHHRDDAPAQLNPPT